MDVEQEKIKENNENDKQANCSFNFNNICDTLKIVCVFSMIDTFGNVDKTGYYYLEWTI